MILADVIIMGGSFCGTRDEYEKYLAKKAARNHALLKWGSCAVSAVMLAVFGIVLGTISGDSPVLFVPCSIVLGAMGFWDMRWIWQKLEQPCSDPTEVQDEE